MTIPTFTWSSFLIAALLLLLLYGVMRIAYALLRRLSHKNHWIREFQRGLYHLFKLYEIIVSVVLCSIFIFIDPILHGLALLAIFVFSFPHIRNYVSGRLAIFDENLSIGKRLKIGNANGVIIKMGQLGIQIRTATGMRFVNYSQLFSEGYSLIAVEEIGGFYQFELEPIQTTTNINHLQTLMDTFLMIPYIDPNRKPELAYLDANHTRMGARILIREDSHLDDFIQLIQDKGYQCTVKTDA